MPSGKASVSLLILYIYPGSESRLPKDFKRFLATPSQAPGGTSPPSFKFVTECYFITQRALHVGLIPAINTYTNVLSELHKQQQAKIPGRNEEMLKQLGAVSLASGWHKELNVLTTITRFTWHLTNQVTFGCLKGVHNREVPPCVHFSYTR